MLLLNSGLLDGLVGSTFFVVGGSLTAVSVSVIGLAWWIGTVTESSSMRTVLGRAGLGALGVTLLSLGLFFLVLGGDATFGHPLGQLLNGVILLAWWLGAKAGFFDSLVTAAGLERLASRRDSNALRALARFVVAFGVVLGICAKICAALAGVVILATALRP